jgi:hypothetical protein
MPNVSVRRPLGKAHLCHRGRLYPTLAPRCAPAPSAFGRRIVGIECDFDFKLFNLRKINVAVAESQPVPTLPTELQPLIIVGLPWSSSRQLLAEPLRVVNHR